MGQGYSMTTLSAASATIDVPELADLTYEKTLASARFMKSVRARNQQGFVFVKAVMKPYSSFDVQKYVRQITRERNALADIPNALGYQRIIEVGSGGFLVRQYIYSSVYDRLSTRPFLEDIEKKWLAYQLLCAVRDCHAQEIYHGDIKTENVLVTSWNWLFLTDFSSSFKPTNLPEDNPADFSFYFDTSSRRTCYLAPERFTTNSVGDLPGELNWAMDMFSVGCVIAEIFLEGPIFNLSQIFKYRAGDYNPEYTHLNKIEDNDVRAMILNMIELEPEKRYGADQHLSFYKGRIFPEYFDSFLHQYMLDLMAKSTLQQPVGLEMADLAESNDKIDRVYQDFDKISYFLGYGTSTDGTLKRINLSSALRRTERKTKPPQLDTSLYDGTLLFLTIVVSSLRSTTKAASRLKACDLLVAFAERLPDEAKLDRILPFIVGLLTDASDVVRVAAMHAMTAVFEMVEVVSPINAHIFPEYVFPKLRTFIQTPASAPTALVRAAYASSMASLALSSTRLLDMVQAIRADGRLPTLLEDDLAPETSFHGLFDFLRAELVRHFEEATISLITDPDASVKRAFLGSISQLCVFFGSTKANDVILTHLNTYLNDKDWILKCSFFEALVGVASYVGSSSLEKFILPIMTGSLTDPEGFVVEKVFRSLTRMANLGLLQKSTTWELVGISVRFLVHPSSWIRESAAQFITVSSRYTSKADQYCIILPMVQPFLKAPITELTELKILDQLKKPLSRAILESAQSWAARKSNSLFWTAANRDSIFILSDPEKPQSAASLIRRLATRISPSQRDREDQTALDTLRNLGMTADDELKLLALREFILRTATSRNPDAEDSDMILKLNSKMLLTHIGITPQNVFFDQKDPIREIKSRPGTNRTKSNQDERHTLADALLDASTTLNPIRVDEDEPSFQLSNPMKTKDNEDNARANGMAPQIRLASPDIAGSPRDTSSSLHLSPGNFDTLSTRRASDLNLKHRNSAINLLNRNDAGKADAEISTTSETVFGRLDGPLHRRSTAGPSALAVATDVVVKGRSKSTAPLRSKTPIFEPNHTYTGTDPNVLRLLDDHFVESFPVDQLDFGEPKPHADNRLPIKRASDMPQVSGGTTTPDTPAFHNDPWRPTGQLLTQFAEHTAAINRVCVALDHAFFVTASDDGTCKIWDATRLEKNVTPRSRFTHRHAPGSKVKALCFVEHTHTFISASDDGNIQAVRVDFRSIEAGESTRYGRPSIVRDYQIPMITKSLPKATSTAEDRPEYAVWLHHYRTASSQSILLVATTRNRILIIDLKTMDVLHVLDNPVHHGSLTTFCVDKRHYWLLVGTSHGILDLWDLRFKLRLRSIGIQSSARIDRIVIHPPKGHGRWVLVSSGGELSVWDIEKMVCREVMRPSTFNGTTRSKPYEPWLPDEESGEKILARFANDLSLDTSLNEPDMRPSTPTQNTSSSPNPSTPNRNSIDNTSQTPTRTIPALHILTDYLHNPSQPTNPNRYSILLSGGDDRTIRYWDVTRPEQSFIVSGPMLYNDDGTSAPRAKYDISHPLSLSAGAQIGLVTERTFASPDRTQEPYSASSSPNKPSSTTTTTTTTTPKKRTGGAKDKTLAAIAATDTTTTTTPTTSSPSRPSYGSRTTSTATTAGGGGGSDRGGAATSSKPMRNTIISQAAAQLLKVHMDGITDIAVLRKPYGCVVSVDRGGCVFVFH